MEKWDLLDAEGNPTGRTIVRGEPLLPGMYHLVEHIWIVDSKGRLLIQQRNPDLKLMPGVWAANSGSAQAGEDSEDAARREAGDDEQDQQGLEQNLHAPASSLSQPS